MLVGFSYNDLVHLCFTEVGGEKIRPGESNITLYLVLINIKKLFNFAYSDHRI
jgi:hypothetical protein